MENLTADEIYKVLKNEITADIDNVDYLRSDLKCAAKAISLMIPKHDDKLAELEAIIKDWYVSGGYKLDGLWRFEIVISSHHKYKRLQVLETNPRERKEREPVTGYFTGETTKEMFDKAFEFFKVENEDEKI